jgi:hypothetical protein
MKLKSVVPLPALSAQSRGRNSKVDVVTGTSQGEIQAQLDTVALLLTQILQDEATLPRAASASVREHMKRLRDELDDWLAAHLVRSQSGPEPAVAQAAADSSIVAPTPDAAGSVSTPACIWILQPQLGLVRLNLCDSLMSRLFSDARCKAYNNLTRSKWYLGVLFTSWFSSCIVGPLAVIGTLAPEYSWFCVLAGPYITHSFLFCQWGMVKRTLNTFEFWFLFLNLAVWFCTAAMLTPDARVVYYAFKGYSIVLVLFADATHPAVLSRRTIGIVLGALSIAVLLLIMSLGELSGMEDIAYDFSVKTRRYKLQIRDIAIQRLLTLLLFFAKNILFAFHHPGSLVVSKSRLKWVRIPAASLNRIQMCEQLQWGYEAIAGARRRGQS